MSPTIRLFEYNTIGIVSLSFGYKKKWMVKLKFSFFCICVKGVVVGGIGSEYR